MFSGRVFPTHVGMNRGTLSAFLSGLCIPHARGDEPEANMSKEPMTEYSPRTWG